MIEMLNSLLGSGSVETSKADTPDTASPSDIKTRLTALMGAGERLSTEEVLHVVSDYIDYNHDQTILTVKFMGVLLSGMDVAQVDIEKFQKDILPLIPTLEQMFKYTQNHLAEGFVTYLEGKLGKAAA